MWNNRKFGFSHAWSKLRLFIDSEPPLWVTSSHLGQFSLHHLHTFITPLFWACYFPDKGSCIRKIKSYTRSFWIWRSFEKEILHVSSSSSGRVKGFSIVRSLSQIGKMGDEAGRKEWSDKLVGKKIVLTEEFDAETQVSQRERERERVLSLLFLNFDTTKIVFFEQFRDSDITVKHRVLDANAITTLEFIEDRLTIRTDDSGVVTQVIWG